MDFNGGNGGSMAGTAGKGGNGLVTPRMESKGGNGGKCLASGAGGPGGSIYPQVSWRQRLSRLDRRGQRQWGQRRVLLSDKRQRRE